MPETHVDFLPAHPEVVFDPKKCPEKYPSVWLYKSYVNYSLEANAGALFQVRATKTVEERSNYLAFTDISKRYINQTMFKVENNIPKIYLI